MRGGHLHRGQRIGGTSLRGRGRGRVWKGAQCKNVESSVEGSGDNKRHLAVQYSNNHRIKRGGKGSNLVRLSKYER